HPLVEADEPTELRFGERQRRRIAQGRPLRAAELDEARDSGHGHGFRKDTLSPAADTPREARLGPSGKPKRIHEMRWRALCLPAVELPSSGGSMRQMTLWVVVVLGLAVAGDARAQDTSPPPSAPVADFAKADFLFGRP